MSTKDHEIAWQSLNRVGAVHLGPRSFAGLSGGEKQRVLIARALAQEADHLLLDEPTNHLDIRYQHDILGLVQNLESSAVIVLHDLNLAARYCHDLVLLDAGHVVGTGTADEVMDGDLIDGSRCTHVRRQEAPVEGNHVLIDTGESGCPGDLVDQSVDGLDHGSGAGGVDVLAEGEERAQISAPPTPGSLPTHLHQVHSPALRDGTFGVGVQTRTAPVVHVPATADRQTQRGGGGDTPAVSAVPEFDPAHPEHVAETDHEPGQVVVAETQSRQAHQRHHSAGHADLERSAKPPGQRGR